VYSRQLLGPQREVWPAPPDRKAEQIRSEWIVPNMFTYYCTGRKSLDEAVSWGEVELQRIYSAKA